MEETRANSPVRKKLAPFSGALAALLLEAAVICAVWVALALGGLL